MRRTTSMPPELPGYTYVRTLGSGGFSDVFLYEQRLPRRMVAVKVLLTEQLNQSTRSAFVAEANLMAQLSTHPYIVTIYHADVAGDGRPYFVMEYASGASLAERYKREPFGVEDALRTGIRLAGAIATAHGAGILHRDIKPANVLTNDFGWPALTDFGISSTLEDDLPVHTTTGVPKGRGGPDVTGTSESQSVGMSVPWSPAEMFEDDPAPDVRSDVFSLAATIHTLLAGQTPFEIRGRSNGTLDLIGRIERGAITPIGRDDVPRSLTLVLQKGMATRRSDRYDNALDFARALQRVELELGYSATGIEVPSLHLSRQEKPDAPAGDDETRVRSVQTIAAQAPAPVRPVEQAPDAASRPKEDDKTQLRAPSVIDAQSPARASDQRSGQDAAIEDGTVLRGARGQTVKRPRAPNAADGAPNAEPTSPARRGLVISVVVAAVVVVGIVVTAVSLSGVGGGELGPTRSPVAADPGGDANAGTGVPAPTQENVATSVDGTAVTFTLGNPDPAEGDIYRWARTDAPNQPKLSKTGEIVVEPIAPGSKICIDAYLQRSDGKLSEAERMCNQ
ncbi:serine/threonine-protein kinase [Glaciibacter superstes]|uniref:serine/threonine-protein kinase n=1 Tax=Glaciibacter superstes TaxID=501023 RepID=UPI0003B37087|nr:serine/threonine-protein kinase [Glaciibacter superstes]